MRLQPYFLTIGLFCMAAIFVGLGFNAKRSNAKLESEGVSVEGKITKAEVQRDSKGRKRYIIRVTCSEGTLQKENAPYAVTPLFYDHHVAPNGTIADPTVTLQYFPNAPESAVIVGGTSDLAGMEWMGAFFAFIGVIFLIRTRRKLSRH